jgi:hypothetical protein
MVLIRINWKKQFIMEITVKKLHKHKAITIKKTYLPIRKKAMNRLILMIKK